MDIDELYGLPLDRFIPERAALAKQLRAAGERDQAAVVAALKKPSAAAWAVNQLVRTQGKGLAELFDAGDALRAVQSDLLAGRGDSADLRGAVQREREAVAALVDAGRGLLSSAGTELSASVLERVADSLHAAALGDEARRAISAARLERELRHVGLGVDALSAPAAKAKLAAKAKPAAKPKPKPAAERPQPPQSPKPAAADVRAAAKQRAEARRAARIAEADARRQVDLTTRALAAAQERRNRAAEALNEAKRAVAIATAEARAAADAHARAKAELESP